MPLTELPKALLFDVFGTVVDWRTTVTNHLISRSEGRISSGLSRGQWGTFAQEWRNAYGHFTLTSDPTTDPRNVDDLHLEALRELLKKYDIVVSWTTEDVLEISRIWHFLDGWSDSSKGLEELNCLGVVTATLSNGNVELLEDMARHANLPWQRIFTSSQFGAYKPKPQVYRGAVKELGLREESCAMVAAHLGDLKAAKGCGLKVIYVEREKEEGWSEQEVEEAKKEGWVDMWVGLGEGKGGFLEVAARLNVVEEHTKS